MVELDASCPLNYQQTVESYFLEHRAKLIDIAAFLDRLDRSSGRDDEDFRIRAFSKAIKILSDGEGRRAQRILEVLSDHSTEPIEKAPMQGALGACPPKS